MEVVAEVDGWLHCLASSGAKGLVPASYVALIGGGVEQSPRPSGSSAYQVMQTQFLADEDICIPFAGRGVNHACDLCCTVR